MGAVGLCVFGPARLPLLATVIVLAAATLTWRSGRAIAPKTPEDAGEL